MKKMLFTAALSLMTLSGMAQDWRVQQIQNKLGEASKDEAKFETLLQAKGYEQIFTSGKTKNMAAAYYLKGQVEMIRMDIAQRKSKALPEEFANYEKYLGDMYQSFEQAYELAEADPKLEKRDEIINTCRTNSVRYRAHWANIGQQYSNQENYAKTYEAFGKWFEVAELGMFKADKSELAKDPNNIEPGMVAYFACIAAYHMKDFDKMNAFFEQGKSYEQAGDQLYLIKFSMLKDKGVNEEWAAFAKEAVLAYPNNEMFTSNLMAYYNSHKMYAELTALAEELIAKYPDNKFGYFAKGTALFQENKLVEAGEEYEKALAIDPEYVDALNGAGSCFYNEGLNRLEKINNLPVNDPKYKKGLPGAKECFSKSKDYFERLAVLDSNNEEWGKKLKYIEQVEALK